MRILLGAALAAFGCLASVVSAQNPLNQPGFVAGGPAARAGVAHALDQTSRGANDNFVNAYGETFVMPAQYCDPMGGGGYGGGGGGGYGPPGTGGDPYGGAYMNTEQCGPHYFDFSAEYLHYQRADSGFGDLAVTTAGVVTENMDGSLNAASLAARTRLTTGDLGADSLNGYRLTGRIDVGALSVFEVAYSGLFADDSLGLGVDAGTTTDRLFSVFSRYGTRTNGSGGVGSSGAPDGPAFLETDLASEHTLSYETELHNAEALFRRYWVGANPRVSGTILLGFRYTSLSETMGFSSIGSSGGPNGPFFPDPSLTIDINADADNHLAGFQAGADGWVTLFQGFRIGAEGKVGIYNNDYDISTSSVAVDGSPSTVSTTAGDQVSFLTEWKFSGVADITPSLSLKGGYELLFISNVALVGDSLIGAQPYGDINGISASLPGGNPATTDGEVFYHGFHAGMEYVW